MCRPRMAMDLYMEQKTNKTCHCTQTTLLVWNISQRVCHKIQNLHLADTFISLSVRSICFRLSSHFSALSRSVKWILTLSLSLSCLLSPHFTFSFSLLCVSPFKLSFFFSRAALFLICCDSSAFTVDLRVSASHVSFGFSNSHISSCF